MANRTLLLFFFFALSNTAIAQDKIQLYTGEMIKAKIKSVDSSAIKYKLWNNLDRTIYKVPFDSVRKLKYHGMRKWRDSNFARQVATSKIDETLIGKKRLKIISFSPINLFDDGIGFSLNYENGIDKKGYLTFTLPIIASMARYSDNSHMYPNRSGADKNHLMYYFCPGLKLYATTCYGKIRYSLGAVGVFGFGKEIMVEGNFPVNFTSNPTYDRVVTGGYMFVHSLNITPARHLYMSLDIGSGKIEQVNSGLFSDKTIYQIAYKLGYRF